MAKVKAEILGDVDPPARGHARAGKSLDAAGRPARAAEERDAAGRSAQVPEDTWDYQKTSAKELPYNLEALASGALAQAVRYRPPTHTRVSRDSRRCLMCEIRVAAADGTRGKSVLTRISPSPNPNDLRKTGSNIVEGNSLALTAAKTENRPGLQATGREQAGVLGITRARAHGLVERHLHAGAKASTAAIRPGGSEDGARAGSVPAEVFPFPHPNDLRKTGYIIVGSKRALGAQRRRAASRQQDAGLPAEPTPPKRLRRPEASAKAGAPALRGGDRDGDQGGWRRSPGHGPSHQGARRKGCGAPKQSPENG